MTQIFAYLDAGSGSMIVQLLVGGVAAVGVTLKLYWRRFKSVFRFRRADASENPSGSESG